MSNKINYLHCLNVLKINPREKKNNMCNQNTIALIDHNTKSTLIVYKEDILFKLNMIQLNLKTLISLKINKTLISYKLW